MVWDMTPNLELGDDTLVAAFLLHTPADEAPPTWFDSSAWGSLICMSSSIHLLISTEAELQQVETDGIKNLKERKANMN